LVNKTPNTKRKVKEEKIKAEIPKLNTFQTFMTLIKGFVCSGILYMPKGFVNGGYMFTSVMMVISGFITIYSGLLLLELKAKTNLANYS
jgi:proton-coupled amino acid transporter